MQNPLDDFYINQVEPNMSCFIALREVILTLDKDITTEWKYNSPFFLYKGEMFCYLLLDKKTNEPYIGIVEGKHIDNPFLESGDRKEIKILPIDPNEDLEIHTIEMVLNQALDLYKNGTIVIKHQ